MFFDGDALLDDVVKGKKPLKTKAEYEAAFRHMARDYVDRKMACIGKIDALPYPEQIKTRMKAEVIRLETFGDINFDVLVEETAKIDVTELRRASRSTSTGLPPSTSTAPLQPRK